MKAGNSEIMEYYPLFLLHFFPKLTIILCKAQGKTDIFKVKMIKFSPKIFSVKSFR